MKEVILTGTLITHKAIVVYPGEQVPKGYIPVAGAIIDNGEVLIALSEEKLENIKLANRLIEQAESCLIRAYPTGQHTWGGF